jgi:mono/diheme cytochrome c family protein
VIAFFKLKAVRWTLIGFFGLLIAAVVIVYAGSAWRLSQTYEVAPIALNAPSPSAQNGERLATLFGCKDCHKANGGVLLNVPIVGVLVTPNLTRVNEEYSDEELARAIRAGVKRDGTSAIAMPADSYAWIADDDLGDIIAWVRSLKRLPDHEPAQSSWGPLGRLSALQGNLPFSAKLAKDAHATPPAQHPTETPIAVGQYLSKIACLHCHRIDAEHQVRPGTIAPPLGPMAQSYDLAQFTQLLRTGTGIGERKLDLMGDVARSSFMHFSNEEIAAIHAYLTSEDGQKPQ